MCICLHACVVSITHLQSKELKDELTKLTAQVKSLEAALEHQIVSATDLRNQVQTHKEELDFKTRLHETVCTVICGVCQGKESWQYNYN